MAQEIAQRAATSVMMPEPKNAFEHYGDSGGARILGEMLKFNKGEWVYGRDNTEMPDGLKLLAGINLIEVGYICWQEGKPVDVVMGRIGEGFVPPRRSELGMMNSLEWPRSEMDSDYGKPRDPWQRSSAMPLVDEHTQVYTFVTGSKGGEGALKALAKIYGKRVRQHPDDIPIVTLSMDSYRHPNKQLGKIWTPLFNIIGWSAAKRLEKALHKAEMAAHEEPEEQDTLAEVPKGAKGVKPGPDPSYVAERPSRKRGGQASQPVDVPYAGEKDDIPF